MHLRQLNSRVSTGSMFLMTFIRLHTGVVSRTVGVFFKMSDLRGVQNE